MSNCPHRIRVRRLTGCTDGYEYTGEYMCVCKDMDYFGELCDDKAHKKCYYPALSREEKIKKMILNGQTDLGDFV